MQMKVIRGAGSAGRRRLAVRPVVLAAAPAEHIYGDANPIGQKIEETDTLTHIVVARGRDTARTAKWPADDHLVFRRIAPNASNGRLGSHLWCA